MALSNYFDVDDALAAGFFDELVDSKDLMARAKSRADEFANLDTDAHTRSKRRIRRKLTRRIRRSIPLDLVDAALTGLRRARSR